MNKKLQIYPVIEISPWDIYPGEDLERKKGQDFTEFALTVFQKHGLESIHQLDPHAYSSVKISEIDNLALKTLIDLKIDEADITEYGLESLGPFCGGMVLSFDSKVITHQCCADVSDYKNWQEFLADKPKDWQQIWIGHPWIYGRFREDKIELSDYLEHSGPLEEDLPIHISVDSNDFQVQFHAATQELLAFKKRVRMILEDEIYRDWID